MTLFPGGNYYLICHSTRDSCARNCPLDLARVGLWIKRFSKLAFEDIYIYIYLRRRLRGGLFYSMIPELSPIFESFLWLSRNIVNFFKLTPYAFCTLVATITSFQGGLLFNLSFDARFLRTLHNCPLDLARALLVFRHSRGGVKQFPKVTPRTRGSFYTAVLSRPPLVFLPRHPFATFLRDTPHVRPESSRTSQFLTVIPVEGQTRLDKNHPDTFLQNF